MYFLIHRNSKIGRIKKEVGSSKEGILIITLLQSEKDTIFLQSIGNGHS